MATPIAVSTGVEGAEIHILLVEDNPGDALLTCEAFRENQFQCPVKIHHVSDGLEAIRFVRREAQFEDAPVPQLILLDLNMPRCSGHEVLATLKRDADLCWIPVVVLTTSTASGDIAASYQSLANCYISKPMDYADFVNVIGAINNFWLEVADLPAPPSFPKAA